MTGSASGARRGRTSAARSQRLRLRPAAAVLLAVLSPAALPAAALGSIVSVRAAADRPVVLLGEPLVVTVTVESSGFDKPVVEVPTIPGARVERAGASENLVLAIGHVMRTDVAVFRVFVAEEGKHVLPSFRVFSGKERAETPRVPFEVVASLPKTSGPGRRAAGAETPLFARFVVDRTRVYWNEQVVGRMQVFSRSPLEDMPAWEPPEAAGFWGEPLGEASHDRVEVSGAVYERYERRVAFFPTRTGRLRLGPARAIVRVAMGDARVIDPFHSTFLMPPTARFVELPVEAAPVDITVVPLPEGAPAAFHGAVGDFSLDVRVDRAQTRAGEPVTVTTTIEGEGNLSSARDPDLAAVPAAPAYAAGTRTDLVRTGERLRGARIRDLSFVPDRPGSLVVLPISFTWFDPEQGRFRTQRSDSIVVRVAPPAPGTAASRERVESATAVPAPPRDGGGRRGALDGWPALPPLLLGAASFAAYAGWGLVAVRTRRRARDPRRRRDAAAGAALEDLERAVAAWKAGESHGAPKAAAEAARAVRDLAGVRFAVDLEGRSQREATEVLRAAGAPAEDCEAFVSILRGLESAGYAPEAEAIAAAAGAAAIAQARRWREACRP